MAKKDKNKEEKDPKTPKKGKEANNKEVKKEVETKVEDAVETVVEPIIVETAVETVVEPAKPVYVQAAPTMKQIFEKSIQVTPFALFQNGMMICRWKQNVNIETFDDGFTINGVKYSYSGIEIKYV